MVDYESGDIVHVNTLNGGEMFQNSDGEIFGQSSPGIFGETNYQFTNGEAFSIQENPIGEGFTIDHKLNLPDFDTFSAVDPSIYDFADSVSFVESVDLTMTTTDIIDGFAGFMDLLGIF